LSNPTQDKAAAKICYFDYRIAEMVAKYNSDFNDFKRRIVEMRDVEVFEEWDDFIIWDSYEDGPNMS